MNLQDYFSEMWKGVEAHYQLGKICSERHLQAVMYQLLMCNDDFKKEFSISIEPIITGHGECLNKKNLDLTGIIPDMVITKEAQIVAVVEIKYVPHHLIPFQKDLDTLTKFWKLRKKTGYCIYLDTNPEDGSWEKENKYTISNELSLIYCVIGNHASYALTDFRAMWVKTRINCAQDLNYLMYTGSIQKGSRPHFKLINKGPVSPEYPC